MTSRPLRPNRKGGDNPPLIEYILRGTGTGDGSGGGISWTWVLKPANANPSDIFLVAYAIQHYTLVASTAAAVWVCYPYGATNEEYPYAYSMGQMTAFGTSATCIPTQQRSGMVPLRMPIGRAYDYANVHNLKFAHDTQVNTAQYYVDIRVLGFGKPIQWSDLNKLHPSIPT